MNYSLLTAFVIIVLFVSIFAFLYEAMPNELFYNQAEYNLVYQSQIEVTEAFEANDIIVYSTTGLDNMTYPYSSLENHPDAPQFNLTVGDEYIEVWWSEGNYFIPQIQVRQVSRTWWGGWGYIEYLQWKTVDGIPIEQETGYFVSEAEGFTDLTDNWNGNASIFYVYGESVEVSIMFLPTNSSKTIAEAWDDGEISYLLSYEIDFNAMKPDVFMLIAQLVTFQNPDFGIAGDFGDFLTYILSVIFWISIALIIFTLVTRLIPTIQGGLED